MKNTGAPMQRLLPVERELSDLYGRDPQHLPADLAQLVARTCNLQLAHHALTIEAHPDFPLHAMSSHPLLVRFLQTLLLLKQPRRCLEVGTFVGATTMQLAQVLPAGAHMTTLEKYDAFAAVARRNFSANRFTDRITLLEGDALALLQARQVPGPFDFIFLDGNKEHYADYFRHLDPLLAPQGLLVVDDALFRGDVFNQAPRTPKGAGVKQLLADVTLLQGYHKLLLPLCNGVMVLIKS